MEEFKYNSLDIASKEIRLLDLSFDGNDEEIRCHLITVPLERVTPYEALSYTWGDPERTSAITLEDIKHKERRQGQCSPQSVYRSPESEAQEWLNKECRNFRL